MNKHKHYILFMIILFYLFAIGNNIWADNYIDEDYGYYTVYLNNTKHILFRISWEVSKGDEYLSSDNKLYEIVKVDKKQKTGEAKFIENVKLPEIYDDKTTQAIALNDKTGERKIGIYSTHSDESYIPTDGTASINGHGGIYHVDDALKKALEDKGVKVIVDKNLYLPHDAMAYTRSRSGAVNLLKNFKPDLILDIHRDAVPLEEYIRKINDKNATGVRIVLGRSNPNLQANKELAYKIKSIADKTYPNLIKDIFFGKGNFNQDLTPNALLFEFGTYTHTRQRAEISAGFMADVLIKALYGFDEKKQIGEMTKLQKPLPRQNTSASKGIWILIGIVVFSIIGFMFLSTGSKELFFKFFKVTNRSVKKNIEESEKDNKKGE